LNEILIVFLFLLIGYLSGILIGMFGIGGGFIFAPVLYYLLPLLYIPRDALAYYTIGTSLFSGSLGAVVSAFLHNRVKNFVKNAAVMVSAGAAVAAFVTPFFIVKVKSRIVEIIFAAILFLVALRMFFENRVEKTYYTKKPLDKKYYLLLGVLVGMFSAFTGLGGGVIYVPALIYLFHIDTKTSVGTSSIIVAITMLSSAASYLIQPARTVSLPGTFGYVVFQAAIPLGIGAVFGAFTGVKIVVKSSAQLVRDIFIIVLFIAVASIVYKIF